MATVGAVYEYLDKKAPFHLQMDFDNAGFLVGRKGAEVAKTLVSLDITEEVVEEAERIGAELIVSHHPVIFHPARSVTDETVTGRVVMGLLDGGIAAICAHTNLDAVAEGVNDALAKALGLSEVSQLSQDGLDEQGRPYGIGRVGLVTEQTPEQFAAVVKRALGAGGVRYVDGGRPVRRVAVGGGACGDFLWEAAALECDAFVTADLKYNHFLDAQALGLTVIDAGHFPTEDVVCPVLERYLGERFPGVEIKKSSSHREAIQYYV